MVKLIIEDDEGKTTVVPLIRDEITIGRKEGNTIRLNLVVHVSDVFLPHEHAELAERVRQFVLKADASDDQLIRDYGCMPAPETQLDFLAGGGQHPR